MFNNENGDSEEFDPVSSKLPGYRLVIRKYGGSDDPGAEYAYDRGRDNDFLFHSGFLSNGYIYDSASEHSFSSIVPDAEIAIGEVEAYFYGNSGSAKVECCSFNDKGWNRVVGIHKVPLVLIENGDIKNAE